MPEKSFFKKVLFARGGTLLVIFLLLLVYTAEARYGGGGGYHGGGGGHYSGGGGYHGGGYSSGSHGGADMPLGLVAILVMLFIVFAIGKVSQDNRDDDDSYYSSLPKTKKGFMGHFEKQDRLAKIKNFKENEFLEKARFAFLQMQESWAQKNTSLTRRFISDSMYQRVNTQLIMMNALGQTNTIETIKLNQASIVYVEKKGAYDIIYVEFNAFINERYAQPTFRELNHQYRENFIEYWAFIRKTDHQESDLYHNKNCPKCGHPLDQQMGEISKCASCGTYTNTGDFDWIISEVIQPDAFSRMVEDKSYYNSVSDSINNIRFVFPDLNVPMLEDKAANAFLQVKVASAMCDPARIRRFSSGHFYNHFATQPCTPFVFNRLFLHKANLINIFDNETHYLAAFNIKCTEQKVRIHDAKLELIDRFLVTHENFLVLSISKKNHLSQHSVFSYSCTNCGGNLNDTTDIHCPYCGSILNDDTRDWVVYGLYSYNEFNTFKTGLKNSPRVNPGVEEKVSGKQKQLRDYVLNNMLVILNADGQLDTNEKKFAVRIAKLLGYKNEEMALLWEDDRLADQAGIDMPEDKTQQQKIYALMQKAASANHHIAPEEQAILDEVKNKYGLN